MHGMIVEVDCVRVDTADERIGELERKARIFPDTKLNLKVWLWDCTIDMNIYVS